MKRNSFEKLIILYIYCGYVISFESVTTAELGRYESTAAAKLKLVTSLPCDYCS